jgi:hypothetical protein
MQITLDVLNILSCVSLPLLEVLKVAVHSLENIFHLEIVRSVVSRAYEILKVSSAGKFVYTLLGMLPELTSFVC